MIVLARAMKAAPLTSWAGRRVARRGGKGPFESDVLQGEAAPAVTVSSC